MGLVLVLRSRSRQENSSQLRRESLTQTRARSNPESLGNGGLRQKYDQAMYSKDYLRAARLGHQLQDNRLYAEAIEHTDDLERAVHAWVECKEFERAAILIEKSGQFVKAAKMYLQAGRRQKAVKCFEKGGDWQRAADVCRDIGDRKKANTLEARALVEQGEHLEAAKRYIQNENMVAAAEQLLKGGDIMKAVEALRRGGQALKAAELLTEHGRDIDAGLLYEEASAWVEAADCYEKLGQHADRERCLLKAGKGYEAGRMAFERGDLERALSFFESIPPVDERYFDAGLFRGQIYERIGKLQEAADAYNSFLQERMADENNRVLFMRVAQILEGIGRPRAALSALGRLLTGGFGTPDITAWASRLEDASYDDDTTRAMGGDAAAELNRETATASAKDQGGGREMPSVVMPHMQDSREGRAVAALSSRYRFGECMGQGGNGIVYRATDLALDRDVVVKFLHQGLLPTDVARQYFMREARTAGKLNHTNIVTIFDIGEEADMLFYSMELVDGQTLADLIIDSGGHLTHAQALPIAASLCDALQYAHDQQVIHRDIKPGNVMVNTKEQVKLLDFGLAKALDENPDKSVFLCGTPFYMSPEQIRREFLDHRTDIYSLGCLLYVMYTGDVPFPDGNVFQHHQQTAPPDPRIRVPDIPASVAKVLMKAIAKDRNQRFQQAGNVASALAE